MSDLAAQRRPRSLLPDLADLFTGFPSVGGLRSLSGERLLKLEVELQEGRYVVRAEIPGIDPANDVDITVRDGRLTIKAERTEKKESDGRSEFSYGSFVRSVTLPPGADDNDIKASYDKGSLSVSVAVHETAPAEKHIAIETVK